MWVFSSYDSVSKMTLELGVKFDTQAGNMQMVVYCPYWFVNKTGLMLSYRVSCWESGFFSFVYQIELF